MIGVDVFASALLENVERVIYGKRAVIEKIVVALLANGHVLLEDVPGVGKTILARALSTSLGGAFRRIQCTPDLLPATSSACPSSIRAPRASSCGKVP